MMSFLRRPFIAGSLGLLAILAVWQIVGSLRLAGPSIPAPLDVLAVYREPWKLALLGRAVAATLLSALLGLLIGSMLGAIVAVVAHLLAPLRQGLDLLSAIINAVPAVALAPILMVTAGRDWTPATLASIPVFFVVYVTTSSGLRSASPRLVDVLQAFGASRLSRLLYLEAPSAVPAFLGGLRISVSAAIVGAIVGEWFGASTGLGIVILNTMLNFQIQMMWAAVLLAASSSLIAYGALSACERYARRRFS
jgi:NitT/TauT family transport system permease protein